MQLARVVNLHCRDTLMLVLHKKVGFDVKSSVSATKRSKKKVEKEQDFRERGMYSSITIDGFRRFDHLELNDLSRINLILGDNNSGKTSVLEAVYTHACGQNISAFVGNIARSRRDSLTGALDFGEGIRGLFKDKSTLPYTFTITAELTGELVNHTLVSKFEPSAKLADLDPRLLGKIQPYEVTIEERPEGKRISLQVSDSVQFSESVSSQINRQSPIQWDFIGVWEIQLDGKIDRYSLTYPPSTAINREPFRQAVLHDILAHRKFMADARAYGSLKRYDILNEFTKEMQKTFPEVCKIDIMNQDNEFLPIYLWGDGLRRWFYLLGNMVVFRNAVHLIDEVEASFHPIAQKEFSKLLLKYARDYDNQLFLTSHSIEFVDNFLEALYGENGVVTNDDEDPVRVITLRLTEDRKDVEVWSFSGRESYKDRIDYNLELR
jgi:predicted ATPase